MTAIEHFPPPDGLQSPPLSYAARVGDLLFVSGLPGHEDDGTIPDGFDAQFHRVVANLRQVLARAGADLRRIAKVNVWLTRAEDVGRMNQLYAEALGPPPYPARTTCVVQALPNPRMLIEIECVADLRKL